MRRLIAAATTLVLVPLGLAVGATTAQAAGSLSVGAGEDTYVTAVNPTANYGTAANARLSGDPEKIGFYKFDVSALPGGEGQTAEVTRATLTLTGISNSQTPGTVDVHDSPVAWDETALSYSVKPAARELLDSGTITAGQATDFDVTAAVQGDANGVVAFQVVSARAGEDNVTATRENATVDWRPRLVVEYGTAKPDLRPDLPGAVGDNLMENITEGDTVQLNGNWYVEENPPAPNTVVTIKWYVDDVEVTRSDYQFSSYAVQTYGSVSSGVWTATPGAHVVKMVIDPDNTVDEADETDNATTRSITVAAAPPPNEPPTVNAGADLTVELPADATLDGTVTDDGTTSTAWTKVSGPGTVTFADASAVDTTAGFSVDGSYVLRLTADDGVNPAVSDDVAVTVAPEATQPPPASDLPYGSGSFYQSRVDGAGVPIDSALTASFQSFMAQHEEQGGKGITWPKVNLNPGWSGHNWIGTAADPVWKLTGTNTGVSNTRLDVVKSQGVHLADSTWATVPTGTQDRLLVIIDKVWGYTVQCADVVPDMAARTWTASNCGIMWHDSNGLDYRHADGDPRNFTSRGRIPDAMQVPRAELDAATAAGTGLGRVMHLFFVGTCGADGHVHPMVGHEDKPCWTGPVPGDNNDGGWGAEGVRLRVKPSVDLVARGLTGEALVIARTLQQNGTYIGDNSGSATQLKLGPPEDYQGTNLTTDVFQGKLSWTDFEVVQPGWQ